MKAALFWAGSTDAGLNTLGVWLLISFVERGGLTQTCAGIHLLARPFHMQKNGNNGILEMLFPVLAPWVDQLGWQRGFHRHHVLWASGTWGDA